MNINIEDYKIIEKKDCNTGENYGLIFLNKKHTIEEFQNAIYKAKTKCYDLIQENGDDWFYIQQEIGNKFDYFEIDLVYNDYVEF